MIYDILETKLETLGLVKGQGIFRNYMPSDVEIAVMTRAPLIGIPIDPHIPGYYDTEIQLITRHLDPVAGNELAHRVQLALTVQSMEQHPASDERGPAHITIFYPLSLPIQFPRLESNGLEWSQRFRVCFGFTSL